MVSKSWLNRLKESLRTRKPRRRNGTNGLAPAGAYAETLEQRRLLSATQFDIDDGVLEITGSDLKEEISVYQYGSQLHVWGREYAGTTVVGSIYFSIPTSFFDSIEYRGNGGSDVFKNGTSIDMVAYGGAGHDYIVGGLGYDKIYGDSGNDTLYGVTKNSTNFSKGTWDAGNKLSGGSGDDKLYGGANDDRLLGGDGKDTLWGLDGDDSLYGNDGNDHLYAHDGEDRLFGGDDDDFLSAGDDDDRLYGGEGDDDVFGGNGDDYLRWYGGSNDEDYVDGGSGQDEYRDAVLNSWTIDYYTQPRLLGGGTRHWKDTLDVGEGYKAADISYTTLIDDHADFSVIGEGSRHAQFDVYLYPTWTDGARWMGEVEIWAIPEGTTLNFNSYDDYYS